MYCSLQKKKKRYSQTSKMWDKKLKKSSLLLMRAFATDTVFSMKYPSGVFPN